MHKASIFSMLVICALLSACAGRTIDNPATLNAAVTAVEERQAGAVVADRLKASILPESTAMFPVMGGNLSFLAVYRNYPDGSTRFAMSLPQGTRLGSAERAAGKPLEFKIIAPSAVVGQLVRATYAALDEYLNAGLKAGDTWYLQRGDRFSPEIGKDETVLVRRSNVSWGRSNYYIYDLSGKPLVYYQLGGSPTLGWKITFKDKVADEGEATAKPSYVYTDYRFDWIINVELVE